MEEFSRIKRLPPYVFNITTELKSAARKRGEDIIDFGMGNPDGATPKAIVDKLYFGVHRPAVGVLTEGVWARLDELETRYPFDQAKAKQLLDDAGWKAGTGGIREKNGQKPDRGTRAS